jgi:Na+-driven multidrug efflux pump
MIAVYGTSVVAAYGVGMQVSGFCVMIIVGIGLGLSSLIGHNVGSGKIERAKKTGNQAILFAVGVMVVASLVTFIFARQFMGMFFESPVTIGYGVTILRIFSLSFPALGMYLMIEEIHMGVGLNTPMMILIMIHSWLLQVLPIYIISHVLNADQTAVWSTFAISTTITSLAALSYYRRGRWLTVKV